MKLFGFRTRNNKILKKYYLGISSCQNMTASIIIKAQI